VIIRASGAVDARAATARSQWRTSMAKVYFVNSKTGKKYEVLKFDRAAGKVQLVGEHAVPFEERYDKEMFQRLGYELQQG
jgi:hypothetical protein